jgi:hypothetical protein
MKTYSIIPLEFAIVGRIIYNNYMSYDISCNFEYIIKRRKYFSKLYPAINFTICLIEYIPQNNKHQKYKIIRDYSILL